MNSLDAVAAQLQGYDPNALHADAALAFLQALVSPVEDCETLPLQQALGRVLAHDLISPIDVPSHDNSAMDGYAFDGALLNGSAGLTLQVVGTALAGTAWHGSVGAQECVRIMTGAMLPEGLDTVVEQEMVRCEGTQITLLKPAALQRGSNRRLQGEDLRRNTPALQKGTRIGPAALGLLASLGLPVVTVRRRLRVAFFSTGNEILSLGEPAREGAIYDSNRYTLFGLLTRLGVDVLDMGVVRDDPLSLEVAFQSAIAQADVLITSGGVSVGEADHTKSIMQKMAHGASGIVFWKIAMRPGRPMAVGRVGNTLLLGLPGNPVAAMVTFLAFVRPTLLQMMGSNPDAPPRLKARTLQSIRKKPGRTEYQRAIVDSAADGSLQVRLTGPQGSGLLSSMVQANGLLILGHDQGDIAAGAEVSVQMFEGVI